MRKNIRRILRILDGTPQGYGEKRTAGQSMVELTLVMPILFALLVGLVEIGWFSRNYLTLLEVTRVGARRGATLQEEYSPLQWERYERSRDHSISLAPIIDVDPQLACSSGPNCITGSNDRETIIKARRDVRDCRRITDPDVLAGFYNLILCQMIDSIRPLSIRANDVDDIIISVFSVMMIDNRPVVEGGHINLNIGTPLRDDEFEQEGYMPVVVGRWPSQANECNVWQMEGSSTPIWYQDGGDRNLIYERDPFDYYNQLVGNTPYDVSLVTIERNFEGTIITELYPVELAEEDPLSPSGWRSTGFDSYTRPELQRGFSFTGQRQIPPVQRTINGSLATLRCWGSERDSYWLQQKLYDSDFILSDLELDSIREEKPGFCVVGGQDCDQREFIPNLGIVLVELYWQHHLLLNLPVFSPVYNSLNTDQTTIYVWSAFPAPSVVPRINYARSNNETIIE